MTNPKHCGCDACKDGTIHASDCAVHNAPALSVGPCDCSAGEIADLQAEIERLTGALATSEARDVGELTDERLMELAVDYLHIDYDRMPAGIVPLLRVTIALATRASEAAPKSRADAIGDEMMDLADRLAHGKPEIDMRAWRRLLAYAPRNILPTTLGDVTGATYRCRRCGETSEIQFNYATLPSEQECCRQQPCARPGNGPCDLAAKPSSDAAPVAVGDAKSRNNAALADLLIREICETDPADPNADDTVCIGVDDLRLIIETCAVEAENSALASQAVPNTATTVYSPEFVRNKFADYETQILNLREELAARVGASDMQQASEPKVTVARMGHGAVAYGDCLSPETGEPGIIFLELDKPREIGADTTDAFPILTRAPAEKVLACIFFANAGSVDGVIETLNVIREKHWPSTAAPSAPDAQHCNDCGSTVLRCNDCGSFDIEADAAQGEH